MYQIPSNSGATKSKQTDPPPGPEHPQPWLVPALKAPIKELERMCPFFFFFDLLSRKQMGDSLDN